MTNHCFTMPSPTQVPITTSSPHSLAAPCVHAVGKLLVKRARMTSVKSLTSLVGFSASTSGSSLPTVRPNASVQDCVELCRLLLEKVGADARVKDTAELDRVLTTEYPPGVADILGRITGALDTDGILGSVSDISDSSDDEQFVAAELPDSLYKHRSLKKELSPPVVPKASAKYNAETEIAMSRIFELGKFEAVQDRTIPASAPYSGPGVVTMTGFGELGRFGNQVLQYAFLKAYAHTHGIPQIQVPHWIGARLFGLRDAPVARALPAVVEFAGTLANSTFTDELIEFVKRSSAAGTTPELNPSCLSGDRSYDAPRNVDIWGWFQWHSSVFAPFKKLLHDTFAPTQELRDHLGTAFDRNVRHRDGRRRTVVGVHLRYGDYTSIAASSFGYCAPTSWYLEWLRRIWPTLDDPLLVVTSDDLKAVFEDFAEYNPITTAYAAMNMPASFKGAKAGFFPDWYALTQCDVLAISNSTFSFSASLMNDREGLRLFRAHYKHGMVPISAWNAHPIVHRDMNKNSLALAAETLQVLYHTQGAKAVARNILYELPYYGVRSLVMKAVLWREARSKLNTIEV